MVTMRVTHLASESNNELERSVMLHLLTKFDMTLMAVGVSKESQSACPMQVGFRFVKRLKLQLFIMNAVKSRCQVV